jgi:hypothetical protein
MLINTILVERAIERDSLWERLNDDDRRALTPLLVPSLRISGANLSDRF